MKFFVEPEIEIVELVAEKIMWDENVTGSPDEL